MHIKQRNCQKTYEPLKKIIEKTKSLPVVSLCLKAIADPKALELVRRFAHHKVEFIRAQAATSLGKIGTFEEIPLLKELICDKDWWVRYRAAQAIANFPFLSNEEIIVIKDGIDDKYGRGIMEQVIAEKALLENLDRT